MLVSVVVMLLESVEMVEASSLDDGCGDITNGEILSRIVMLWGSVSGFGKEVLSFGSIIALD